MKVGIQGPTEKLIYELMRLRAPTDVHQDVKISIESGSTSISFESRPRGVTPEEISARISELRKKTIGEAISSSVDIIYAMMGRHKRPFLERDYYTILVDPYGDAKLIIDNKAVKRDKISRELVANTHSAFIGSVKFISDHMVNCQSVEPN